ncbi:uncharacterized protein LOC117191441 [Drosophila miranda]|uniref:uncharacterized protein LOC117191441 n=1 Tax=Drosophila miranda TaxID=7229 RepID=UPI00143FB3E1|nr:uncharacterized protein LOC117191441 [Drosophila miranda]
MLPVSPRKRILEPPKCGRTTSSSEIYHQIVKNIAAFPEGSVIKAEMMHLNIAEKCFFVGMWGAEPLQKLFEGKLLLKELDQLPNFGEIFAVYDCHDGVIPRVTINDYADEGGYDAYLIDFGEHIHMTGDENIFALPDDIRLLPAEAIRCFFKEGDVSHMTEFRLTRVALRVLEKCGGDFLPRSVKSRKEQGICGHYDPKLNGCFKGRHCRLLHELFAPQGVTKDLEVEDALPETEFDAPFPKKFGSIVEMQFHCGWLFSSGMDQE